MHWEALVWTWAAFPQRYLCRKCVPARVCECGCLLAVRVCVWLCSNARVQIVWTKYDRDRLSPIYYPLVICLEVVCLLVCDCLCVLGVSMFLCVHCHVRVYVCKFHRQSLIMSPHPSSLNIHRRFWTLRKCTTTPISTSRISWVFFGGFISIFFLGSCVGCTRMWLCCGCRSHGRGAEEWNMTLVIRASVMVFIHTSHWIYIYIYTHHRSNDCASFVNWLFFGMYYDLLRLWHDLFIICDGIHWCVALFIPCDRRWCTKESALHVT